MHTHPIEPCLLASTSSQVGTSPSAFDGAQQLINEMAKTWRLAFISAGARGRAAACRLGRNAGHVPIKARHVSRRGARKVCQLYDVDSTVSLP